MPRSNYTKAGSRRACKSIQSKLLKLHQDGWISAAQWVKLDASGKTIEKRVK